MISFYPGPSRVHDAIPRYVKEAYRKGILSINHRSDEFMKISAKTIALLKKKLSIPEDYTIFYTTSATECWEIIAQSVPGKKSHHIFNGSFGQKWYDYSKRIRQSVRSYPFEREELVNPNKLKFGNDGGVICITQNETSNGTQVAEKHISAIRENNPAHLIAIDATSSMAGISLDFASADIWFASVQKCFGLPAGLGVMACSPRAIDAAVKAGERNHYNSLTFMNEMMEKWQTPFTPNVLGIYLLMRVLEDADPVKKVHSKIVKRYKDWIKFLEKETSLEHLISNRDARSYTVIPVSGSPDLIAGIKSGAKRQGILLGEGYGDLKATTFRIANFPAIRKKEIRTLQDFLRKAK